MPSSTETLLALGADGRLGGGRRLHRRGDGLLVLRLRRGPEHQGDQADDDENVHVDERILTVDRLEEQVADPGPVRRVFDDDDGGEGLASRITWTPPAGDEDGEASAQMILELAAGRGDDG